ncbi:MAG: threonine/serine exporter family protein [Clostridia bacterium]|nr:threonine/serine exporter family protein [Clostridia bacterium]MBQ9131525.1 threonine/serine exporter family protein [Clostridia bacterium]
MKDIVVSLLTAALGTLGFSILFYVHPRRLTLATLGGVLTTAVYLLAGHLLGGELLPNLLGALVGAGFSEICARLTKVPVPVYMVPCVITLVPGSALYATMFNFVSGNYAIAADAALTTLVVALGIAGGIVIASVIGLLIRPRRFSRKGR